VTSLEKELENFFEKREGAGSYQKLREVDLLDEGLLDSLDMVELATIVSTQTGVTVDLSERSHFQALRSIDSILTFFGE
jgi:acyl carrier protein